MSTLLLIRHGQARAFQADGDRLSDLGREQARLLGEHFARSAETPDEVICGSLRRQRDTASIVADVVRASGRSWPESHEDPRWNEYDADRVLTKVMPELARQDHAFAGLAEDFQRHAAGPERNRYFQRMFEVLMDAWASGRVDHPEVEPFGSFHQRVVAALGEVTGRGGSRRVLVFTSGGPIGVCVQHSLGAPATAALRVNWRVKNTSLTEHVFSTSRLSLDSFNVLPHLTPAQHSFR